MPPTRGKAWTFGDHINTEAIMASGKEENREWMKDHVLEYYDPEFPKKVQPGDFIVAGRNFGASSGRPAGEILKAKGVRAILCESAGTVFYRNTWNMGLPVLECPGIRAKVEKGDELEADIEEGTIKISKTGEVLRAQETPWILLDIYRQNGMLGWIQSRRRKYRTLEQSGGNKAHSPLDRWKQQGSMPPSSGEISSRWERIRERMARENLAGFLVLSSQLKKDPVHYVANYTLLGERACFYLPAAAEPVLFISEAWDQARAAQETHLNEVRVLRADWPSDIASAVGASPRRLGIAGKEILGHREAAALEAALGRELISATRLLEDLAAIKSAHELDRIRAAAQMADAGFLGALEAAQEGMTDYELAAEIDHVMREMGATDNFLMIAVGQQNTGMLLPCGEKIQVGDLLLFEITPAYGAGTYSAQLCKTAIFGESPSPLLAEKYALLVASLQKSLAVIKPGVAMREVARIQNEIIGQAGYAAYCRPPYMRVRGHGFGLGRFEFDEDSSLVFAEGMSLVVHPNQFIPETGYLALGESIIVTAEGIERLTTTDSRIYPVGR